MGELTRENAVRIELNSNTLEELVNELMQYRNNNISVVARYAGKDFDSDDENSDDEKMEEKKAKKSVKEWMDKISALRN